RNEDSACLRSSKRPFPSNVADARRARALRSLEKARRTSRDRMESPPCPHLLLLQIADVYATRAKQRRLKFKFKQFHFPEQIFVAGQSRFQNRFRETNRARAHGEKFSRVQSGAHAARGPNLIIRFKLHGFTNRFDGGDAPVREGLS